MSTSQCGNICVMPPKCSREERRHGLSKRSSVEAAVSGRSCVFLCECKSTLFGLFMDDRFVNLGEYKAGCAQMLFLKKKRVNSDFAMTIWCF